MNFNEKKILIFMPSIEGGGVEKNLFIISNFLTKKFKNINLITTSREHRKKFTNIKIISPKLNLSNKSRKVKYLFCLYELFKILIKRENVLIISFQANLYCILVAKLFKKKILVRSNSSPSGWSKNFLKKKLFKFILQFADTIIVNSIEFKKEFKKKFNLSAVNIYNPLNKEEILKLSKKKISFPFFDQSKESLKIINIARFTDQKDHLTLLRSANVLKKNNINFKLLIIGRGTKYKNMKKYVIDHKMSKMIKILNFKNNPFPYLNKSDVFLLTSKFEGLPNVLLEALVLKKIIVSTDCPTGPKEILQNGKLGFLCRVGDYQQIAKNIEHCKHKNKKINKIINKAYNSLDRFNYMENLNKYYLEIQKLY